MVLVVEFGGVVVVVIRCIHQLVLTQDDLSEDIHVGVADADVAVVGSALMEQ